MCAGDLSFDKVRAVIDVATPETERELRDQALECTVRELADVARMSAVRVTKPDSRPQHEGRYLRFNDEHRTMNAQLPAESYAATRAWIDALAAMVPSDRRHALGPASLRRAHGDGSSGSASAPDRFDRSTGTTSPYFVVVHAPIEALVAESGDTTELAGELERDGLIDCETVQRIACDATIAVAVDDDRRPHHVRGSCQEVPEPSPTPRSNATGPALSVPRLYQRDLHQCAPHRRLGNRAARPTFPTSLFSANTTTGWCTADGWTMSGDANGELRFVGPSGRVMVSRPSVLWTRVTAGSRASP